MAFSVHFLGDHPPLTQLGLHSGSRCESSNRRRRWGLLPIGGLLILSCAPAPIFPAEVLEKVDSTVRLEQAMERPADYEGRVVEFGGEIVRWVVEGEELQLLVRALPIQTKPVFGPVDRGGEHGLFIIRYTGKVGKQDLYRRNMVVVIGQMMGAVLTNLTGVPVRRPTVKAECLHIWRTQGEPIEDYPYPGNSARYVPLVQQTYCINGPNTILTTS